MSDEALMRMAARVAGVGISVHQTVIPDGPTITILTDGRGAIWSPLTNDDDATGLAARLGLNVLYSEYDGTVVWRDENPPVRVVEMGPPREAKRRAIVRAAAVLSRFAA